MKNNFSLVTSILTIINVLFWLCAAGYYSTTDMASELGLDYSGGMILILLIIIWFIVFYMMVLAVLASLAYMFNSKTLKILVLVLLSINGFFALLIAISSPNFMVIYPMIEILFAGLALKPKRVMQNNYGYANNNFVNVNEASHQDEQIIANPIVLNNMGTDFNNVINNEVRPMKNNFSLVASILAMVAGVLWVCIGIYYSIGDTVSKIGFGDDESLKPIILALLWLFVLYAIATAVLSFLAYKFNSKTLRIVVLILLCIAGLVYLFDAFSLRTIISIPLFYIITEILFASLALKPKRVVPNNYGYANNYLASPAESFDQQQQVIIATEDSNSEKAELKGSADSESGDIKKHD